MTIAAGGNGKITQTRDPYIFCNILFVIHMQVQPLCIGSTEVGFDGGFQAFRNGDIAARLEDIFPELPVIFSDDVEIPVQGEFHGKVAFVRGFPGGVRVGIVLDAGAIQRIVVADAKGRAGSSVGRDAGKVKEAVVLYLIDIVITYQAIASPQLEACNDVADTAIFPNIFI